MTLEALTSESTMTIYGAYGTILSEKAHREKKPQYTDPLGILYDEGVVKAKGEIATEYWDKGARVVTLPNFGIRRYIGEKGGEKLYGQLTEANAEAVKKRINDQKRKIHQAILVNSLGPMGDCYTPDPRHQLSEASDFHSQQAYESKKADTDIAWFETVPTITDAQGMALAAKKKNIPCVISFVLGKDGNLLSGESLAEAIESVDLISHFYPLGYGINCCPPEAIPIALSQCDKQGSKSRGPLSSRIISIYPNASSKDHAELDGSGENGTHHKVENNRGTAFKIIKEAKKRTIKIIGGCCGYTPEDIGTINELIRLQAQVLL